MDRATADRIVEAVSEALKQVEKDFGVKLVERPRCTFSDADARLRFTFADDTAASRTKQAEKDERGASVLGLTKKIGDKFATRGRVFTITGVVLRRPKFPVSASRDDGRKFKFPVLDVNHAPAVS